MADEDIQSGPRERPPPRRRDDDEDRPRRRHRDEDDDDYDDRIRRHDGDGVSGLIPYKNPMALISYYCGVFSLIPCVALALGPTALVLGLLGLNYKKKHPTAGGTAHAIVGIVLGLLTTLAHIAFFLLGAAGALFG